MFSRKTVAIVLIAIFLASNGVYLFFSSRHAHSDYGDEQVAVSVTGPFQDAASRVIHWSGAVWHRYFFLVSVTGENEQLRAELDRTIEMNSRFEETQRANERLRKLLDFKENVINDVMAAQVVGRDPNPWFRSITIDRGEADGLRRGLPVVVSRGIVGVVTTVAAHYSIILLIVDQNSAVDVLVQETRVRGLVKGNSVNHCSLEYVLLRHEVHKGDAVVTSGLDGVFPKGLRVGEISEVAKQNSGIFQEIYITPYVDFETIEEVLVILNPPAYDFLIEE